MKIPIRSSVRLPSILCLLYALVPQPAFAQAQDYTYTTNNGTITITKYLGSGGVVTIPGTINGLPVTSVGSMAFASISNLTSITIPDSVTSIGDGAFQVCTGLTSVRIPNSVTNIGYGSFWYCAGLTNVTIPDSVTSIGNGAFRACSNLLAIAVDVLNISYSSEDGVLFNESQTTLIQCPGGKTGSYTAPNSVTNIGQSAFYSCPRLTSVAIPDNVITIGELAFYSCISLTNVTIPDSVTSIGYGAFASCTSLTKASIGNSVTNIGDNAFSSCTRLTHLTIGNSVTSIGRQTLLNCPSLTAITVNAPNSAYSSEDGVLFNKSRTTLIHFPGGKAGDYSIPNGVTNIGELAFYSCINLTHVTIPESVISIEGIVFYSCSSLTAITVDAFNSSYSSVDAVLFNKSRTTLIQYPGGKAGGYTIPNSVTSIGTGAFENCSSLTSVIIPSSVTSIGSGAFSFCDGLVSVTIPDSVNILRNNAFSSCASLTRVRIGDGVTSIEAGAFWFCTNLTSVTIGNSVTNIDYLAFYSCGSLINIKIPGCVTSIGRGAFADCTNLMGVYFQGNAPSVGPAVFDNSRVYRVYYLPGTTGWGPTFADCFTALWFLPNPVILNSGTSFGVRTNTFGFIISWATNASVVVEASANLTNPTWSAVSTNTLVTGSSYFRDPGWTNYLGRFYRIRSP